MDARLIVVGGKANKSEVKLKLPTTIGRSRAADLTVAHPKVSRQHCQIFERDGVLMVRDNGSLNGTYIEDTRITESILMPGQKLTVGPLTFLAAYEPVTADAGMMPTVDLPAPMFESGSYAASEAGSDRPVPPTVADADAWFDDPDQASDGESAPGQMSDPLQSDDANQAGEPPVVAPSADDFRVSEPFDLAETAPADAPWGEQLRSSDPTVNVPQQTVAFEPRSAPTPLSPDDFRMPDDDDAGTSLEAPPADAAGNVAEQADSGEQSVPGFFVEDAASEMEPIAWSSDSPDTAAPQANTETIQTEPSDNTLEFEPSRPAAAEAVQQQGGDPPVVAPATAATSKDQPSGRKGWWPFSKKKNAPNGSVDARVEQDSNPGPSPAPLPAEPAALQTGELAPIDGPDEAPQDPPAVDEVVDSPSEPPSSDDEELNQFLKSLGQ